MNDIDKNLIYIKHSRTRLYLTIFLHEHSTHIFCAAYKKFVKCVTFFSLEVVFKLIKLYKNMLPTPCIFEIC